MKDLVVGFSLDGQGDLVWKICGHLVHGECHLVDVKDSYFGALGILLATSNGDR